MDKKQVLKEIRELSRYSVSPDLAKKWLEAFDLELPERLIRTHAGYRETDFKPNAERVSVSAVACFICEELKSEPDKDKLELSQKLHGVGSSAEVRTEAYVLGIERLKNHE